MRSDLQEKSKQRKFHVGTRVYFSHWTSWCFFAKGYSTPRYPWNWGMCPHSCTYKDSQYEMQHSNKERYYWSGKIVYLSYKLSLICKNFRKLKQTQEFLKSKGFYLRKAMYTIYLTYTRHCKLIWNSLVCTPATSSTICYVLLRALSKRGEKQLECSHCTDTPQIRDVKDLDKPQFPSPSHPFTDTFQTVLDKPPSKALILLKWNGVLLVFQSPVGALRWFQKVWLIFIYHFLIPSQAACRRTELSRGRNETPWPSQHSRRLCLFLKMMWKPNPVSQFPTELESSPPGQELRNKHSYHHATGK